MGTDGGKFDVSDRVTADRLNRKTVFIGTGSEISALATYPGMLAYSTAAGSGLGTDVLYERNSADNGWSEIIFAGSTQTLINKTLSAADNAITDSGTSLGDLLKSNGSKFLRWARGTAHTVLQVNSAGTDLEYAKLDPENLNIITQYAKATPNSSGHSPDTGYEDVTGATVTITAKGGKAGLVAIFMCTIKLRQTSSNDSEATIVITDENNNIKATQKYFTHGDGTSGSLDNIDMPFAMMAVEAAPNAGSITRKARVQVNDTDVTCTFSNMQIFVMEVA